MLGSKMLKIAYFGFQFSKIFSGGDFASGPLACICYRAETILMEGPYDIQISMSPLALESLWLKNEVFCVKEMQLGICVGMQTMKWVQKFLLPQDWRLPPQKYSASFATDRGIVLSQIQQ